MEALLSRQAINALIKLQRQLLLAPEIKVAMTKPWLIKVLDWCQQREIVLGREAGGVCYINARGIAAIEAWYVRHNQGSLNEIAQLMTLTRSQLSVRCANEKLASQLPTQDLVLVACLGVDIRQSQQQLFRLPRLPHQVNVETHIEQIDLGLFDHLVVVENRDCFNEWYCYQLALLDTRTLVVYRGHEKHHSRACAALKARWRKDKGARGLVYFGDFDIAGLAIAIDSKVAFQHVLLPSLSILAAVADPLHFDEHNSYQLNRLESLTPLTWQPLLSLLQREKKGLRQQRMLNCQLVLY